MGALHRCLLKDKGKISIKGAVATSVKKTPVICSSRSSHFFDTCTLPPYQLPSYRLSDSCNILPEKVKTSDSRPISCLCLKKRNFIET